MWYLPRPGIEPVSPALAGGFFTTGPPGKSYILYQCNNQDLLWYGDLIYGLKSECRENRGDMGSVHEVPSMLLYTE